MTYHPFLFDGELVNGRLSNELWLAQECPAEFRDPANPWRVYVTDGFTMRIASESSWEYLPLSSDEQYKRDQAVKNLLWASECQLGDDEFYAVLAWMFANLLATVPEYTAAAAS